VTARQLLGLFDLIYLVALANWIGGALFMMFGLGPMLLKAIGTEPALNLVRAVFPRYYVGGAITGALALASFIAGPLCYHEYRGTMVAVQALLIIAGILLMLYGANSVSPAIRKTPGDALPDMAQLARRQRVANVVNLLVGLLALLLLAAYVLRPAPKTSGIIEMTPLERSRYDAALGRVIADVEARYGLRPPRALSQDESADPDSLIDAETVREIESYYAQKRLRDQVRAGKTQGTGELP
jgi:hypothetical protein